MGSDLTDAYLDSGTFVFQSTLPVWGATGLGDLFDSSKVISIHAPRMGSDHHHWQFLLRRGRFQSTLPVWGATSKSPRKTLVTAEISIHAPRMGSDPKMLSKFCSNPISIHAPRMGSDCLARLCIPQ